MRAWLLVVFAGLIWGLIIMLGGWAFGYHVPFFGAWVIGYSLVVFRGGFAKARIALVEYDRTKYLRVKL